MVNKVSCGYCGQVVRVENTACFKGMLFCFKRNRYGEVYLDCLRFYKFKASLTMVNDDAFQGVI